ncbi:malonate decarboxylase subunit delta [Paenibacillus sp. ClWae2A]|uniref:malonate decarboxylase subunit delta n=1 Tax=Paenibacillus sp. ClWae2A TaxID=3057177 RepID=UPI0028F62C4D|nr:malonate decarboxylase subunit delta [Paenibacillus sp. ClWae2A]MDT9719980.1 malonate decarboxylase subunit delta [Paenibacillus sp. ClWae2A]
METMTFKYKTSRKLEGKAHVGVAGSGDLELLMEPSADGQAHVEIRTTAKGFGDIWRAGLDRFFQKHDVALSIQINDFGATPGVVNLRLAQAMEVLTHEQ